MECAVPFSDSCDFNYELRAFGRKASETNLITSPAEPELSRGTFFIMSSSSYDIRYTDAGRFLVVLESVHLMFYITYVIPHELWDIYHAA